MSRGRHRQAPPLHRLLFPLAVGGTAVALAAGAWAVGDPVVLRVVAAAAAAAACTGAFLLRRWDQSAGKSVAELKAARQRDEWRTDERIAELEVDLEDSRELRGRLENKLRAKRAELARLRTEHADLLRRYATAESERARTLEDRRRLALDAGNVAKSSAVKDAAKDKDTGASRFPTDAEAYAKADEALQHLSRNGARQAAHTIEEARRHDLEEREEPQGRHAADRSLSALPMREHRGISEVAAAVLPYSTPQCVGSTSRAQGGFDFFGTSAKPTDTEPEAGRENGPQAGPDSGREIGREIWPETRLETRPEAGPEIGPEAAPEAGPEEDFADVVGDEALAEHRASNVIDLTAHDETEQLDLREFRTSRTS